jgi:predicted  nucleic acid-binding Zn-ribbon protein
MARSQWARDDDARAAIQAILRELPEDHPAREAYRSGADPTRLITLVEREDLVEKLNQAWLDWYSRRLRWQRAGSAL